MGEAVDVEDLVDAALVARILGLSNHDAVREYRRKYSNFPDPALDLCARCPLWRREDIVDWGDEHPQRRRKGSPQPDPEARAPTDGAGPRFVELEDLVNTLDVADLIGLGRGGDVSKYRARYKDFPKAVIVRCAGRCSAWRRRDVLAWRETVPTRQRAARPTGDRPA